MAILATRFIKFLNSENKKKHMVDIQGYPQRMKNIRLIYRVTLKG